MRTLDAGLAARTLPEPPDEYLSLRDVVAFAWRNLRLVALFVTVAVGLAVWYIVSTPPTFTATARLYIDPEQVRIASSGSSGGGLTSLDTAMVESQVQIVKSEAIALAVIRQHDLINDLELLDSSSLAGSIKAAIKAGIAFVSRTAGSEPPPPLTEEQRLALVMSRFYGHLGVRRVGQSYLIQISYRSTNREKAARLANATANAYIGASLNAKARAAGQGSDWLEKRIIELGEKASETATAVREFRAENGLVETGDGRSLGERELLGTSDELIVARAAVAEAAARLETIDAMLERGDVAVFVDDAVRSGTIARLRQRLVEARANTAVLVGRYGENGKSARSARDELVALEREVSDELSRIRQSYAAELEAARRRAARVRLDLQGHVLATGQLAGAEVKLAELQARETAYRRMYANALEQFEASQQKASFPVPDARIVMPATVPVNKSHPKSALVAAMGGAFGVIAGFGCALMRESLDRRVGGSRATGLLRREVGLGVLGTIHHTRFRARRRERATGQRTGWGRRPVDPRRYVLDAPRSAFSEALRGLRASIDLASSSEVPGILAVTSIEDKAGRSTIASNLAMLYAASGRRTLLIDADRGAPLHAAVVPGGPTHGLLPGTGECPAPSTPTLPRAFPPTVAGHDPDDDLGIPPAIDADPQRSFDAICDDVLDRANALASAGAPAGGPRHPITVMDVGELIGGREILESPGLACLRPRLESLREQYEAVILDLPAMRGSSGVRSLAGSVDGIVLVVRHRRCTIDAIASAVASFGLARDRVLGAVINDIPRGKAYG